MRLFLVTVIFLLLAFGCEESENAAVTDDDKSIVDNYRPPLDNKTHDETDNDAISPPDEEIDIEIDDDDVHAFDEDVNDEITTDIDVDNDIDAGYPYDDIPIVQCNGYNTAVNRATINIPELTEMSGFGISLKNRGVIWTHNDSGSPAEIFAINKQGELLGKITLSGANADDWEDIAIGRCGNDECIYIADTGNNLKNRTNLSIYRFVEPSIDAIIPFGEMTVSLFETFPFSYPDTTHDCEGLAVNKEGVVYLFTKDIKANLLENSKTFIYKFAHLTDDVPQTLFSVGFIETGRNLTEKAPQYAVTAAAIDRTGTRLLLRMYSYLWEYRLPAGQPFESIFTQQHSELTAGNELQGESVDYDPYTGTVYHTSELFQGITPVLYEISCAL